MKRIVKWSLILGGICCVAGIGTITAGAVMGGGWHLEKGLRRATAEGLQQLEGQLGRQDADGEAVLPQGDQTQSEEKTRIVPGTDEYPLASSYSYTGVRRLDIELLYNNIELREWDGEDQDTILIGHTENGGSAYNIRQNGDKLELKADEKDRRLFTGEVGLEPLLIYVPRGYVFDEFEVENDMGSFLADTINAGKLSLECSAGEIVINGGAVRSLDVECDVGSVTCLAAADTNADIECDTGAVVVTLAGVLENYDYSMECDIGEILIGGDAMDSYSGLNKEHHLNHHTGRSVELECHAGSIAVNFSEPAL